MPITPYDGLGRKLRRSSCRRRTVGGPRHFRHVNLATVVSIAPACGWLGSDEVAVAVIRILWAVEPVVLVVAMDVVRFWWS